MARMLNYPEIENQPQWSNVFDRHYNKCDRCPRYSSNCNLESRYLFKRLRRLNTEARSHGRMRPIV